MEYYYAKGSDRFGPIPEPEFSAKVRSGEIGPHDLVWKTGSNEWKPLRESGLAESLDSGPGLPVAGSASPPEVRSLASSAGSTGPPAVANPYQPPAYSGHPGASGSVVMAPQTSGAAVTSLVCGIVGISGSCPPFAIIAIIAGHMALSQINRAPDQFAGKGLAVAGLILGYLVSVILLAVLALIVVFVAVGAST